MCCLLFIHHGQLLRLSGLGDAPCTVHLQVPLLPLRAARIFALVPRLRFGRESVMQVWRDGADLAMLLPGLLGPKTSLLNCARKPKANTACETGPQAVESGQHRSRRQGVANRTSPWHSPASSAPKTHAFIASGGQTEDTLLLRPALFGLLRCDDVAQGAEGGAHWLRAPCDPGVPG